MTISWDVGGPKGTTRVLLAVAEFGETTVTELTRGLSVSRGTVERCLIWLEDNELVVRGSLKGFPPRRTVVLAEEGGNLVKNFPHNPDHV